MNKVDDILVKAITQIANARIGKQFPLMGKHYLKESSVLFVMEAFVDLAKLWEEKEKK